MIDQSLHKLLLLPYLSRPRTVCRRLCRPRLLLSRSVPCPGGAGLGLFPSLRESQPNGWTQVALRSKCRAQGSAHGIAIGKTLPGFDHASAGRAANAVRPGTRLFVAWFCTSCRALCVRCALPRGETKHPA